MLKHISLKPTLRVSDPVSTGQGLGNSISNIFQGDTEVACPQLENHSLVNDFKLKMVMLMPRNATCPTKLTNG